MSVLLDTHIWIWWLTGGGDLSIAERATLDASAEREAPLVSAVSLWEVQMLHARRRFVLQIPFEAWLLQATAPGVTRVLPLDVAVVLEIDRLPQRFHGDPADRIIVATARALAVPLATHDGRIRRSRLVEIWKARSE